MSTSEMTAPRAVLALDGGNSKTDILVVAEDGTVLSRTRSGPFTPHLIGAVAAVDSLSDAIEEALAALPSGRVDLVAGYLANADLPIHEERIQAAILTHGWSDRVVVENDTLAMLRTGTSAGHGVAVVCGAGINSVGVGENGERVRYSALGRITGEWGGGLGIAKQVLWHSTRGEDGRDPQTALSAAVAAHFGLPSAIAVAEAMHLGTIDYDRMHEIVPVLFATAEAGDPIARSIVLRQAEEIALLATTAITRLGLADHAPEVVLGGGMLTARQPLLNEPAIARILMVAPEARIVIVEDDPIVGSALLGLELLWDSGDPLTPEVRAAREHTLRQSLRASELALS